MTASTTDIELADAACRLWLSGVPSFGGLKTAAIGNFRCASARSGRDLLASALDLLRRQGFAYAIGPMDGTTWHSYRLVIESDGSAPFLMEPENPDFYPDAFHDAGFRSIATYASARVDDFRPRGTSGYAKRLARTGIGTRCFDAADPGAELDRMYDLAVDTFQENFLYTPISRESFHEMYRPVLAHVVPDFVQIAENQEGAVEAFLFAIPDFAQGPTPDSLIVKTYASRYPGLGGYLAEQVHARAGDAGFRSVIHALMHEDNQSKRNSEKYGGTFRRYALYGRDISP